MARNASGTYTLPAGNPVVSGTLIDATWANNTLSDLGNEMTDSLSRSGEGAMLAPLRITDGVQATPSLAFSNEPSSGLFRAGSNEWWAVAAGVQNLRFTNTGLTTRAAAGAVGTPSIAAFNDTDTGIYFPGANELAIATGGVGALWVNSSQNVGIGTASPAGRLDVNGGAAANIVSIRGAAEAGSALLYTVNTNASETQWFVAHSTSDVVTGNLRSGAYRVVTNNIERMRVSSGGDVGIGTASPTTKLDVNGSGIFSGTLTATLPSSVGLITSRNWTTTATELHIRPNSGKSGWLSFTEDSIADRWIVGVKNGNGGLFFNTGNPGSNTDRMVLDTSGNLGIGTASPASRLDVTGAFGTSTTAFTITNSAAFSATNIARADFRVSNSFGGMERVAAIWGLNPNATANNGGALVFGVSANGTATTPSEVARFDQAGNFGIGTSSPESKLDVRNGYITGGTNSATSGSKLLANYYTGGALSTWGAEFSTGAPTMGYGVWPSPLSANSFVSSTNVSNLTRGAYTIEGAAHKWFIGGSQTVAVDGAVTMSRAMTLDAAGYLGIGTTSPGSRLHVDAPTNTVQIRAGDGNVLTYAAYSSGVSTNALNYYGTASNHDLGFLTNNTERARITKTGNIVAGASVALATTATDGFLYVPTCAGTPTGTPTAITGMAPIVVNTTNNKLYFYSGGAWRDAGP